MLKECLKLRPFWQNTGQKLTKIEISASTLSYGQCQQCDLITKAG